MAEQGYVYERLKPADRETLAEIVRCFCPASAYLLQERLDDLKLKELPSDWPDRAAADPSEVWSEGRIFGARCEVRWLQAGSDAYQVMLLMEQPPENGLDDEWGSR